MKCIKQTALSLLLLLSLLLSACGAVPGGNQPSFSLEDIPEFSGEPYVVLEDNQPAFTQEDLTAGSFEEYTPLDVNEIQVEEVFPGDFDGVLAPDDELALQIRSLAERAGKVFGKDFIVTGYNGSHLVQKIAPDLPTVVRPVDSLADELIDTLLKRIADPTKPLPSKELPVRLTNPLPN